ncbi:kelch-like protein 32 isoform X1 [Lates japonicus]|uniref:Kelch-like protein 32 isoform X1 n=1 Tax=Lates japonicus TaxID=270547 RepID=A0AAD3MD94_LATJO|nr:kelch-like protein 32 isoform X1 [Lates japonicus]
MAWCWSNESNWALTLHSEWFNMSPEVNGPQRRAHRVLPVGRAVRGHGDLSENTGRRGLMVVSRAAKLVVLWLEHDCRYQYTEDLLQHVRYGLMDVPTLHHLANSHPLVQSSPTAAALVDEALDYHHATFAQPLRQSARTRPRFQSLTLYIAGGRKREVSRVRELRYFNPAAQEHVRVAGGSNWSELAPMPTGRSHHCVAVMGNFLFVVGGEVEHATGRTCAVRTACRYDPRGNRWTEIAPMKACREHFVLGALGQYLYAVGGRNELRQVLPSVERYCPKRNKWMFVQPFDRSLSCHAGCVADNLLWVSGGVTNTAQYQNRLMVYDPEQDQWLARSPMLQRRVYHVMAAVRRQLYVLGGDDLDYNNDRILVRHIDSYNMDLDQWTRCSFSLLTGRVDGACGRRAGRMGYQHETATLLLPLDINKLLLCNSARPAGRGRKVSKAK